MLKTVFLFSILHLFRPAVSQIDGSGLIRMGLHLLSSERSHLSKIPEIEKEVEAALTNSVHEEKILQTQTFISASVKRIFGLISSKDESEVVDKHYKRTNLIEVAKNLNLTTFLRKAKEAGIDDILDHEGQFTVFAPTNDAFDRVPSFCSNVELKDLMKFHVSKGAVPSSSFKNNLILHTLLTRRGTRINVYQNKTVVTANGRHLNQTDFKASNGILHTLDDVMCAVYRGGAAYAVSRCPNMTVLTKALKFTGLDSSLDRNKRATLFAPTDNAFSKIPQDVLESLFNNVTALTDVLLYHVVPSVWYSAGLEDGQVLTTLLGQNLKVAISGNVTVNNATVILADATVKNGVVHAVDTVLLPSADGEPTINSPEPVVFVV